jgi:CMP-N-acetylneuraminic acid synthetase
MLQSMNAVTQDAAWCGSRENLNSLNPRRKQMFYNATPDFYIDTVQNTKKQLVSAFVQHDGIKTAMNSFIDGQTAYTKSAVKVATEVGTRLTEESVKAVNEIAHFDLAKFFKVPGSSKKSAKTEDAE